MSLLIMRVRIWMLIILVCVGVCVRAATSVNIVYIHGVQGCPADRLNAGNALTDLKNSLSSALSSVSGYTFTHTLVNLYTEPASPCVPANSRGPTYMDDWKVGDGCGSTVSGDNGTTAYEWRYRLANKIKSLSGNVILIGHSTGARVAVEVAANVGRNTGPNTYNWGVQNKILGVASVNGMVNDLNGNQYNLIGPTSFLFGCKNGDIIFTIGQSCAMGNGWCEYAGLNSGVAANDWVAKNKFALNLVSWASCSPNIWTGLSDGALPYDAQSSPQAPGLDMSTVKNDVFTPTNGIKYGAFCHSAITSSSFANHGEAVSSATNQIKTWLTSYAQRVARAGSASVTTPLAYGQSSPTYTIASGCPAGSVHGSVVVGGVCHHPGLFDGNTHSIISTELSVTDGNNCDGSYKWTQKHDQSNPHAADLYYKAHARWSGGVLATSTITSSKKR